MEIKKAIELFRKQSKSKGALLSTDECKQLALWLEELSNRQDEGLKRIAIESYWGATEGVLDTKHDKVYVDMAIAEDIRAGVPIKLHF